MGLHWVSVRPQSGLRWVSTGSQPGRYRVPKAGYRVPGMDFFVAFEGGV
jgi:hypothetical protein